jgi:hypothetical protein
VVWCDGEGGQVGRGEGDRHSKWACQWHCQRLFSKPDGVAGQDSRRHGVHHQVIAATQAVLATSLCSITGLTITSAVAIPAYAHPMVSAPRR